MFRLFALNRCGYPWYLVWFLFRLRLLHTLHGLLFLLFDLPHSHRLAHLLEGLLRGRLFAAHGNLLCTIVQHGLCFDVCSLREVVYLLRQLLLRFTVLLFFPFLFSCAIITNFHFGLTLVLVLDQVLSLLGWLRWPRWPGRLASRWMWGWSRAGVSSGMVDGLQLLDKRAHFGLFDLLHSTLLSRLLILECLADLCLLHLRRNILTHYLLIRLVLEDLALALAWLTLLLVLKGRLGVVLHLWFVIIDRDRLQRCQQIDHLVLLQLRLGRIGCITKFRLHRTLGRYLRGLAAEELLRRRYLKRIASIRLRSSSSLPVGHARGLLASGGIRHIVLLEYWRLYGYLRIELDVDWLFYLSRRLLRHIKPRLSDVDRICGRWL